MNPRISIIVSIGRDPEGRHLIGRANGLLWPISDDLKRFRSLTMGHPIIMGRKTFDSIGRPLPGRTSIVVTRDAAWTHEGVITAHSLDEALAKAKEVDQTEIFVIGGGEIYRQALPHTNKLYLTRVDAEEAGDTFFPPFENEFTKEVFREERRTPEGLRYTWVDLERP
jgi:dihydrofolate reductase